MFRAHNLPARGAESDAAAIAGALCAPSSAPRKEAARTAAIPRCGQEERPHRPPPRFARLLLRHAKRRPERPPPCGKNATRFGSSWAIISGT